MQYGSFLSPAHYKTIKPVRSEGKARKSDEDSLRLYIGVGRKDGITKRKLAEMLSRLLSIPERLVDDIEVMDKFSLATMPKNAANDALRLCKKKRGLPHMHIDVKSEAPANYGSIGKGKRGQKRKTGTQRKRENRSAASKYKRK